MKIQHNIFKLGFDDSKPIMTTVLMVICVCSAASTASADEKLTSRHNSVTCSQTSQDALKACGNGVLEVYWLSVGKCKNSAEKRKCSADAKASLKSDLADCRDQKNARRKVCDELGGGVYDPNIDPSHFTKNLVGNQYFPLLPKTYTYHSFDTTGALIEKDVVQVTDQTRIILGVTTRAVKDTVTDKDDNVLEDTTDWFAQDTQGNVWYFGEIAQQFAKGVLVGIDGSWTTGVDGAKPGYVMLVAPQKGNVYRQEFLLGEAEDMGRVIGAVDSLQLPAAVSLPSGVHGPYLHTQDFSALEPASLLENQYEDKFYAPGVGLVLTIGPDGTKEVLVNFE